MPIKPLYHQTQLERSIPLDPRWEPITSPFNDQSSRLKGRQFEISNLALEIIFCILRPAPGALTMPVILAGAKHPHAQLQKNFIKRFIHSYCVFIVFVLLSSPVYAFYKWEGSKSTVEINGMLQAYGLAYKNPDDSLLFKDNSKAGLGGLGRVILKARKGESLSFDLNAYQTYLSQSIAVSQTATGIAPDVERSSALEWSLSKNSYTHTAIDRLSLRWTKDRVDIIAGRQPINLATTFYFTPNDFFAPFAAQTFYRVYKPGVDAVRTEVRLGELSQLSLIGVLGYDPDKNSSNGWSKRPTGSRASYLGRISKNIYNFEWALIAGMLADEDVIGGSAQGEMFKWLGVRAEAHVSKPESHLSESHAEYSVGIEHHWESSLDARVEYFYHGAGATSVLGYTSLSAAKTGQTRYFGRRYAALGIGYEFTPLLTGQSVFINNLIDHSLLASFNAVYSLSNESELSFSVGVPFGKRPKLFNIRSEYGAYPSSLDIEWRWYF
jgi:hypothetical protein